MGQDGKDAMTDAVSRLCDRIRDCRVVGLGEASHGDLASIRYRALAIRELAERGWLRAIAFERNAALLLLLDAALQKGSPEKAVADAFGTNMRPWVYAEVRQIFEDVRAFNQTADVPVRLIGVDMQNDGARTALAAFLRSARLPVPLSLSSEASSESLVQEVAELGRADSDERVILEIAARSVLQQETFGRMRAAGRGAEFRFRDDCLAANTITASSLGGTVFWAHNGHVSRDRGMAGRLLGRALGRRYYSVGVVIGGGSYFAWTGSTPVAQVVTPAPRRSVEDTIARLGTPVVDLEDNAIARLLTPRGLRRRTRSLGIHHKPKQFTATLRRGAFDALVWANTTAPPTALASKANGDGSA